jgi:hypothetical protein
MENTNLALINAVSNLYTLLYRPELNKITGSMEATILLQQIIYWSLKKNCEPFYKFKQKCTHEFYKNGDSWFEELGFSRRQFDNALNAIGFKKGTPPKEQVAQTEEEALIVYWTDSQRLTWYSVNFKILEKKLVELYSLPTPDTDKKRTLLSKDQNELYQVKTKMSFTNLLQKNTPEITDNTMSANADKTHTLNEQQLSENQTDNTDSLTEKLNRQQNKKKSNFGFSSFKKNTTSTPKITINELREVPQIEIYNIAEEYDVATRSVKKVLKEIRLSVEIDNKYGITNENLNANLRKWVASAIDRGTIDKLEDWVDREVNLYDWHPDKIEERRKIQERLDLEEIYEEMEKIKAGKSKMTKEELKELAQKKGLLND